MLHRTHHEMVPSPFHPLQCCIGTLFCLPIVQMSMINMLAWVEVLRKGIAYSTNGTTMRYPYHNQWFCGCGHFFGMEITLVAGMELAPDVPVHNKWAHDTQ